MYKSTMAFVLAALVSTVVGSNAQAQTTRYSLVAVAGHNGYNLQWLLAERSVRLYRTGLVIVIRPGATMYEVNNRVEFADAAPQYVNGDLLVTPSLAARLVKLASLASAASASRQTFAPVSSNQTPPTVSGPIVLQARSEQGDEAINVSGHAPSAAPVTITLLATISPDIPTLVVSRHDVQPDANGQFQATIPIASDYFRDSVLRVLATSGAATPASTTVLVQAPNAGVTVPSDKPYCPNTNPTCP
jgi:hypothetical protein